MRAYGYARVSLDEDGQGESIATQRAVIENYAASLGITLLGVFLDNNVSGYVFDRPELKKLVSLVENDAIDVVIAKDLSRVGRHNAKVLLFLDYLNDSGVRLILTDGYDSTQSDDTLLGINAWYNEHYLRDLSRKVRAGQRVRQKAGMVEVEPYGYRKDHQDKHKLVIDETAAAIVRRIFRDYLAGAGTPTIAHKLNSEGVPTPGMHKQSYRQSEIGDKNAAFLWKPTTVRTILQNEAYIGTFRCGVSRVERLKGERTAVPDAEQFVHKCYMEPIVCTDDFERAQAILSNRTENRPQTSNAKVHRYAGLMVCDACGSGFTAKRRVSVAGERLVYVCTGYHKHGSRYCSPHNVDEMSIDAEVFGQMQTVVEDGRLRYAELKRHMKQYNWYVNELQAAIVKAKYAIEQKRAEIKGYAKQLARHQIDESIYDDLSAASQRDLVRMCAELSDMEQRAKTLGKLDASLNEHLERLSGILKDGQLTHTDVMMLIKCIRVRELDRSRKYKVPEIGLTIEWWVEELAGQSVTKPIKLGALQG